MNPKEKAKYLYKRYESIIYMAICSETRIHNIKDAAIECARLYVNDIMGRGGMELKEANYWLEVQRELEYVHI
jgi:hypothetical protein